MWQRGENSLSTQEGEKFNGSYFPLKFKTVKREIADKKCEKVFRGTKEKR